MKYPKRYNKFTFQTNCRICLTQSISKMVSLDTPLVDATMQKPLVYEAMETVMSEKIDLNELYPQGLCPVCIELLKIAYDLKIQYCASKKKLKEELGEQSDNIVLDNSKTEEKNTSVEILVGSERFNIHDIFIVEEDSHDDEMFDGFLNNLGKSITASFVEKGYKKPKPVLEVPSLVIEKVSQDTTTNVDTDDPQNEEIPEEDPHCDVQYDEEDVNTANDDEITNIDNIEDENADEIFNNTPVNEEMINMFATTTENDKKLLESAKKLKYKCPFCDRPMASLKRVKLHTSGACKKNKLNTKCYVCGITFELRKQLLSHLRQEHLMKVQHQVPEEANQHKCHLCGKVLRSHGNLFYHLSKHLGKRYNCDKCDKGFYTRSQARIHRQTHNRNETLVVCPVCGKGFHYQSGLFYHMKIHNNERNLQCSYCPRRFYTRNSVKRHELTHTGARPYACNYCDKAFRSLGEVKKHKLLHTGERPYHCKYCSLGFTQLHNLRVHLMTHPGEFQCVECSKGFREKDTLRFHMRTKHGVGKETPTKEVQNEDDYTEAEEEVETLEQEQCQEDIEEQEDHEEQESVPEEEYYYTEEYVDNEEQSVVSSYEVADEVLVETVEDNFQ